MTKRLQHPKGPANMKANYLKPVLNELGEPELKKFKGFTGFKGWVYHPTRGFKKVNGFKPTQFHGITMPEGYASLGEQTEEILTEGELATLLSGS